jgi:hypothetical protein
VETTENYAIRVLEESKQQAQERYTREIAEIESAIAKLRIEDAHKTGNQQRLKVNVDAGQYKGLTTAHALQAYLNQIGRSPAKLDDVVRDLLIAGVEVGKPDRRKRNLKIVITNNPKLFIYNEHSDTVELIADPARSKRLPGKVG